MLREERGGGSTEPGRRAVHASYKSAGYAFSATALLRLSMLSFLAAVREERSSPVPQFPPYHPCLGGLDSARTRCSLLIGTQTVAPRPSQEVKAQYTAHSPLVTTEEMLQW